jgi:hypothetical protein
LQALFQTAQHLYEKREGSRSGSGPLNNGYGSPTLQRAVHILFEWPRARLFLYTGWCWQRPAPIWLISYPPHQRGTRMMSSFSTVYIPTRYQSYTYCSTVPYLLSLPAKTNSRSSSRSLNGLPHEIETCRETGVDKWAPASTVPREVSY